MDTQKWWNEINTKHEYDKWSGGFEIIAESKRILAELDTEDQNLVINYLTKVSLNKEKGYALALNILIEFNNEESISKIYGAALNLKDSYTQDEIYYIYLLKIIASNTSGYQLDLINDYVFANDFNKKQSLLHWALWPKNKELFCRAYAQFLEKNSNWVQTSIVSAFISNPDALRELKKYLISNKKKQIWKVLKNDLKFEIKKDIWDKDEIKKLI